MAIDIEAIRAKLDKLNNPEKDNKRSDDGRWLPDPGEYIIRVLPWKDAPEGEAFKEVSFYYNVGRGKVVALESLGKEDPVQELRISCFQDGSAGMREIAKQLFSKSRSFAAMILRGKLEKGELVEEPPHMPKLLDMNPTLQKDMLALFFESGKLLEYTHLQQGFDINVIVEKKPMDNGGHWHKLIPKIPREFKASPAGTKEQIKEWMDNLPDLAVKYPAPTYDELKTRVDTWLAAKLKPKSVSTAAGSIGSEVTKPNTDSKQDAGNSIDAVFNQFNNED